MPKGGWGHGGFGWGHGWGHGPGFFGPGPGLAGALVAGAATGLVLATYRPPPRYHRYPRERVIIVQQPPQGVVLASNERLVELTCPSGVSAGASLEVAVEGRHYYVQVPDGVGPGMTFQAKVQISTQAPVATAVAAPPPAPVQATATASAMPVATAVAPPPPPTTAAAASAGSYSSANPFAEAPPAAAGGWVVQEYKSEYDAKFKAAGPGPDMKLTPANVKASLQQTGLPAETLRPIWELSDIDKDGKLDQDEFAVACYLCWMANSGYALPPVGQPLPDELMPPSKKISAGNPF